MHDAFLAIGQYGNQLCKDAFGSMQPLFRYQDGHTALCQKLDHTFSAFSELCKLACKMLDHNFSVQDAGPQICDHIFFVVKSATTPFLSDDHRVHREEQEWHVCDRPRFSLHQSVCSEILDDGKVVAAKECLSSSSL